MGVKVKGAEFLHLLNNSSPYRTNVELIFRGFSSIVKTGWVTEVRDFLPLPLADKLRN